MSDQPGASTSDHDWLVLERWRTSIGAQCWTLRRDSTQVSVFAHPRGEGVRVVFTDVDMPARAVAHAARCYAAACDEVLSRIEPAADRRPLDARPVGASEVSVQVNGSDALVAVATYFGEAPFCADPEEIK